MLAGSAVTGEPIHDAIVISKSLDQQRMRLLSLSRPDLVTRFDRAAHALAAYIELLNLTDVGPLTGAPSSPNILREVVTPQGGRAVLKLIGEPAPGEAATLAVWTEHGVPAPPLLEHGIDMGAEGVTHLLLGKLPGQPVAHAEMPGVTQSGGACAQGGSPPAPGRRHTAGRLASSAAE